VKRGKVTTPHMYWDATFTVWDYFGVAGQPAAILLDKNGKVVKQYSGFLDTKKVLTEAKKLK
jgi:thioredoxin-related protein